MVKDDWSLDQHLLALILDTLRMANWQRQGRRGARKPEPVSPLSKRRAEKVGDAGGRDPDEVKAMLHAYRTGAVGG